jgi:hypothetical protein
LAPDLFGTDFKDASSKKSTKILFKMKKLMFVVAGLLFVATVTFAQDSTGVKKTETTTTETTQSTEKSPSQDYTADMVKIKSTDLPDAVKQTLGAPQYAGWETAPLYRSKNNDLYVVELKSGSESKTFRFGADGKPVLE